jgi:hypothetical protein
LDWKTRIPFFRSRLAALLSLCIVALLGFYLWSRYEGPYRAWIRYYITGVIYVLFWLLAAFIVWPRRKNILKIVIGVLLMTFFLEFLQLWKPPFLQQFRSTFFGAALIGTDFVWAQFPYYIAGSLISWLWLSLLCK